MRIDSHQHFWHYNPQRENWITDDMASIRKDFLPADLKPVLKSNGMDGCVAVQANNSEEETEFLLDLASQYPFIKGVVGWVDLRAENVEERLSYFARNPLLKGIRHTLQGESLAFITSKEFERGISKLSKYDLSYDLLVVEHQLKASIELVNQFQDQKFVLDHMAKPSISEGVSSQWARDIQELADSGNVYCKLSGMVTETTDFKWNISDFFPFLEVVVNSFGTDKLLYGSDWPVCLTASKYGDTLQILHAYFSSKGQKLPESIMGASAREFYNL